MFIIAMLVGCGGASGTPKQVGCRALVERHAWEMCEQEEACGGPYFEEFLELEAYRDSQVGWEFHPTWQSFPGAEPQADLEPRPYQSFMTFCYGSELDNLDVSLSLFFERDASVDLSMHDACVVEMEDTCTPYPASCEHALDTCYEDLLDAI